MYDRLSIPAVSLVRRLIAEGEIAELQKRLNYRRGIFAGGGSLPKCFAS